MSVTLDRLDENTWVFNEEGVRFFLLTGKDKALLIDSGMQTHNAKELAEELTDLPLFLLNTHADPDHIGSNHEFESFYMHPAEATNFYKTQNREGKIIPIWDQEIIDLGERPLKIIEIPGHTPGSVGVLDIKNRQIFSGDPVQDGHIFMFGPQREMHSYIHSLDRLEEFSEQFDKIYPSHGTYPVRPEMIGELSNAARDVLDGKVASTQGSVFGMPVKEFDVGIATFLCDEDGK